MGTVRRTTPAPGPSTLHEYNPIFSRKNAAQYLGISPKTLDRLNIDRSPMPGTGKIPMMGYRLVALNAFLESLTEPRARKPKVRTRGVPAGGRRSQTNGEAK